MKVNNYNIIIRWASTMIAIVVVIIGGMIAAVKPENIVGNQKPVVSETPAPAKTPVTAEIHSPSETPAATKTPELTEKPAPTELPPPTETPTETPTPTLDPAIYGPGTPVAYVDYDIQPTEELINYFENNLFVGDSLMLHFRMKFWSYYSDMGVTTAYIKAENLGKTSFSLGMALNAGRDNQINYQGERLYIWEIVQRTNSPRVFVEFGANDTIYGVNTFVANCERLVNKIHETNPDTEVVFINMPPMNHTAEYPTSEKNNDFYGLNNDNIRRLNAGLEELCKRQGYGYIDLYTYIVDETGHLTEIYNNHDTIHENNKGYLVWNQLVLKYAVDHINNN